MYFENPHKQIWSKFGCRGLLKYHFGAICKNEQNFWRIVQNTGPRPNPNPNQCLDFCKITLYLCILRTPINKFAEIIEVFILSNSILELLAFSQCPPNVRSWRLWYACPNLSISFHFSSSRLIALVLSRVGSSIGGIRFTMRSLNLHVVNSYECNALAARSPHTLVAWSVCGGFELC